MNFYFYEKPILKHIFQLKNLMIIRCLRDQNCEIDIICNSTYTRIILVGKMTNLFFSSNEDITPISIRMKINKSDKLWLDVRPGCNFYSVHYRNLISKQTKL